MPKVHRLIEASPTRVWDVLSDGWLYPVWVVGATRMREVDDNWPAAGSKLYHSIGVWPAVLNDDTEVLEVDPGRCLHLRASGWPLGQAKVLLTLDPEGPHTSVTIDEHASSGPGKLTPRLVHDPAIAWRNTEALRRLAFIAEGRARG